jgi:hypothetical protein
MQLIQMPDGTWMRPSSIRVIEAVEAHECKDENCGCGSGRYPPGVFVITRYGKEMHPCESFDDAEALRDKLAALVNNDGYEEEEVAE